MAKPSRPGQGERRICLPRDYTVVDTETTGLSTESCCLIEVSALRVREGRVAAEFSTLIRPPWREVQKNGQWQQGYVDDFIQGLTGITDEMLEGAPLPEEALPQVEDFLGRDITGICCSNDMMALGVYQECARYGLRIPDDLSVIGFDNIPSTALPRIELTTIEQPKKAMAIQAVEMLLDKIEHETQGYVHQILLPSLVERATCRSLLEDA